MMRGDCCCRINFSGNSLMIKVLLIQNSISSYRVPVYNLIAKEVNLTVMYSEGKEPSGAIFNFFKVPVKKGHFYYRHTHNIRKIANGYDVVIGMIAFNWISNYMLPFGKRKYKFIPWGIGVPASYSVRFDDPSKKINVFLTKLLIKKSDAVIFYTDYPVDKYAAMGLDKSRMFVAHNTVEVLPLKGNKQKDSILFVGTLYRAKSSISMLDYYKQAYLMNRNIPKLRLVGNGDEFEDINDWVRKNNMKDNVVLEGAIYDESVLRDFFESAYACVSLGQAGLSVQKAMGYAVPFITTANSFTGGERLDIINNENGVLLKNESDFTQVVLDIASKPDVYVNMGIKAKQFYDNNRTIHQMAEAVIKAINYVI